MGATTPSLGAGWRAGQAEEPPLHPHKVPLVGGAGLEAVPPTLSAQGRLWGFIRPGVWAEAGQGAGLPVTRGPGGLGGHIPKEGTCSWALGASAFVGLSSKKYLKIYNYVHIKANVIQTEFLTIYS